MTIPNLSRADGFTLIQETTAVHNLLTYGVQLLCAPQPVEETRDPILAMLSIGMEKLYKVTLGLAALDTEGAWIPASKSRGYSHGVKKLHEDVWNEIESRIGISPDHVRNSVSSVNQDVVVPPLVAALDRYGLGGRFYHIDALGGDPQEKKSPVAYWDEVDDAARLDSGVQSAFTAAMANHNGTELWNDYHRIQRERIAWSIRRPWFAISVCAVNGVLGEAGRKIGRDLGPDMKNISPASAL